MPDLLSLITIIAQTLPDPKSPEAMGWMLLALGGLMAALNQGGQFIDRFRAKKDGRTEIAGQPVKVIKAEQFATVEMHAKLEGRVDAIQKSITDGFANLARERTSLADEVRRERVASAEELRKKFEESMTGISGELKSQTDMLGKLDRESGEQKVGIANVAQQVSLLASYQREEIDKVFKRINAISIESSQTKVRVDGIENREAKR